MTNYEYIKRETEKETLIKGMSMAFPECGMHKWCDLCKHDGCYTPEVCEEPVRKWLELEHKEEED